MVRRQATFKWLTQVLLVTAAGLFCTRALAETLREEHTFEVSVTIPTNDFYVLPVNPEFLEREQKMAYNTVTETLAPLREHFDVKNTAGGISARLAYLPRLSNGFESIALSVSFNGEELSLVDTPVVSEALAKTGQRVPLVIAAVVPDGGYVPGRYYGNVQLMFDALRP
jgi:hypothetical protein